MGYTRQTLSSLHFYMNPNLPPPLFLAESSALDFLNTLARPVDVEVEWLGSGDDLLAWLNTSGLVDSAVVEELKRTANPGELDAVAAQARALREWFREFVAKHRGKPLNVKVVADLEPLNRLLARDQEFVQVVARHGAGQKKGSMGLELVHQRNWRSPETLLLPIANAFARLVTDADFTHVKHCEGPHCILHFLDTTRDHRRRWCSMAVCGNRAKQAALRNRRAAGN
jgi:predicted RNA-binding Zn ribbon-like protein